MVPVLGRKDMKMTLDEFSERYWTNGMTCEYGGVRREIMSVDFAEQLIGLKSCDDSADVDMVRCENVNHVMCPVCDNRKPKRARGISSLHRLLW